jgi:hypothetical protein
MKPTLCGLEMGVVSLLNKDEREKVILFCFCKGIFVQCSLYSCVSEEGLTGDVVGSAFLLKGM